MECNSELNYGAEIPKELEMKKSLEDWQVEDVLLWLKTLSLSTDYSDQVVSSKIDGKAIIAMAEVGGWTEFFSIAGDRLKVQAAFKKLSPVLG